MSKKGVGMTDEQIAKAWEKCIDATRDCCGDDTTCPYCTDEGEGCAKCFEKIRIDVCDLIKRQRDENERLKRKVNYLKVNNMINDEHLHIRLTEKVRSEAIKEFAQRLRKTLVKDGIYPAFAKNIINNLVKEMTEGSNVSDN